MKEARIKGLVIGGIKSGCGKTTITLGIMAALTRRGLRVAPFKVGPDFIDPGHHSAVTGVSSRNLDGWMLSRAYNLELFQRCSGGADVAVVEGVMGLFDGYDGRSEAGSTAQMAKWLDLPVILVVDASSMARSAAALVRGFESFDPGVKFAGVIFNNIGSPRHLSYLTEALAEHVAMPCLGGIVRDEAIAIPERHLGLVTRDEHVLSPEHTDRLADMIERSLNPDTLLKMLPTIGVRPDTGGKRPVNRSAVVRIAVAMDKAFCFYYQDNISFLEFHGAEIIPFSPISAPELPHDIDGLYFGGGYPELFAGPLAANESLRRQIREKSIAGMPVYGECGGFMYLCREIREPDGNTWPMTNCFPFATTLFPRLRTLGYREVLLEKDTIIGRAGQRLRGHEFHYSDITQRPAEDTPQTVYAVTDRCGQSPAAEGYQSYRTLGSYIHLHFGSLPDAARHFVETCLNYRRERIGNEAG